MKNLTVKAEDLKKSGLLLAYSILVGRDVRKKAKGIVFFGILAFVFAIFAIYDAGVYKSETLLKLTLLLFFAVIMIITSLKLEILSLESQTFSKEEILVLFRELDEEENIFKEQLVNCTLVINEQDQNEQNVLEISEEYLSYQEQDGFYDNILSPMLIPKSRFSFVKKLRKIQNHLVYTIPFEKIGLNIFLNEEEESAKNMIIG